MLYFSNVSNLKLNLRLSAPHKHMHLVSNMYLNIHLLDLTVMSRKTARCDDPNGAAGDINRRARA